MRLITSTVLAVWLLMGAGIVRGDEPAGSFPLKDGDIWVMAGDSITAQHLHSNYFEAFCFARYPQMKFAFRNSGVGGHTIPSTLARFDYDVAAWKPTVISVELGMNDAGGTPREVFLKNMETWLARVRSVNARPILFSPSAVNDGSLLASLAPGNRNIRLDQYSTDLKELAKQEQLPYADQFHDLIDLWGENYSDLQLAGLIAAAQPVAANAATPGVEHLQEFLKAQKPMKRKPVSLQGNPVHPGPCGQLMMAASLLKQLGTEGFVSSVSINADGMNPTAKGCTVTAISTDNGTLAFERLDERLPFPVPADAAEIMPMAPEVLNLSQYTLQVNNLNAGNYEVRLNQIPVARVSAQQLGQGINLTAYAPGLLAEPQNPVIVQGTAILNAVAAKEALVSQWRAISKSAAAADADPKLKEQLPPLNEKIVQADEAIRKAAQPQKLKVEIVAVK